MKPALVLVDLQNDFLGASGLEPPAADVVRQAARLLAAARDAGAPVIHVLTAVDPSGADRMPHWKRSDVRRCLRGTPGQQAPAPLAARGGEPVVEKTFFSAFGSTGFAAALASAGADTLVVTGVHLHGCVRATVLDAYEKGFEVRVAEDAVGSDDPLHAAVTRRYLEGRAARFAPVDRLVALLSGAAETSAVDSAPSVQSQAAAAAREAETAGRAWRASPGERRALCLRSFADRLERDAGRLGEQMAREIGKPVTQGRAEAARAAALVRAAAALSLREAAPCGPGSAFRRVPLGVVAVVTPWNNPLAIPWGKIAPALALGNAVVWKPAPTATRLSEWSLAQALEAGFPEGLVGHVAGDHRAAVAVMQAPGIDAVSLAGSSSAGWAAQEICARRRLPLQAELGGNNAAIVWTGADLDAAAAAIARGAFGFAGQRCTANRRAVVAAPLFDAFLGRLSPAVAALAWGDPLDPATEVGPLVSEAARDRVAAAVGEARASAEAVLTPHLERGRRQPGGGTGAWFAPTLVVAPPHASPLVQDETFGPVLLLERAADFDEALELSNGVRQGLVAALFSGPGPWRERFDREARAGVVKFDASTADADAFAPFGGWKGSGLGPPEHGQGDVEFFSRLQAVYGKA